MACSFINFTQYEHRPSLLSLSSSCSHLLHLAIYKLHICCGFFNQFYFCLISYILAYILLSLITYGKYVFAHLVIPSFLYFSRQYSANAILANTSITAMTTSIFIYFSSVNGPQACLCLYRPLPIFTDIERIVFVYSG